MVHVELSVETILSLTVTSCDHSTLFEFLALDLMTHCPQDRSHQINRLASYQLLITVSIRLIGPNGTCTTDNGGLNKHF